MCGIAGLWAPRIDSAERTELVTRMLERLRHRGPNGSAVWNDSEVSLGLMRLAIVAPDEPTAVASNEMGRIHSVANGEIYNHGELRLELRGRGHSVGGGADTATVPHLYEEAGTSFPLRMDGQFAVAVWDSTRRRLVLARDRVGEKPLFTFMSSDGFAFASEPGALAALPWYKFQPDPDSIARYLVHGFVAGDDCAFAGMQQLPPGHTLEVSEDGVYRNRYWRPWDNLRDDGGAPQDPPATTREVLAEAVASRLPEEVDFGVFLSGGVDSGLVATLAARAAGKKFPTFSLRFNERGYDESPLARAVAKRIGSDHHEITMRPGDAEAALENVSKALHQPLGDPSVLPTWVLSKHAAAHVPVVLTGEGADELFAGYPTYLGHRYARMAARLPESVRRAGIELCARMRPEHHHLTIPYFIERFLEASAMPPFERHVAWFGTALPDEAPELLAPELRSRLSKDATRGHLATVAHHLAKAPVGDVMRDPKLLAYQVLDIELYLGGGLLTKVDRATMDHGMEARAPFLQPDLIRFALGLPESLRLRGRTGKWVLKQAARGLLPDETLAQRKKGFSPPFSTWIRGPLKNAVRERLSAQRIYDAGVLDPRATSSLVAAHLEGRVERSRTVWALLSLQMWAEYWSKMSAQTPSAELREVEPPVQQPGETESRAARTS